jgi:hypothetical protein
LAVAAGVGYAAQISTTPMSPPILAGRFCINAPAADPLGRLGERFRPRSRVDALVLAAPTSDAWSFKLYAQRALVVDDKNMPFTDAGIREWRKRMETLAGAPLSPGNDPTTGWRQRDPEALAALARGFGATHILTQDAWHPTLPGRRVDGEAGWSLWELPTGP